MLTTLLYATLLGTAPLPAPSQESPPTPVVETTPEPSMRSRAPIMAGVGATLALSGTVMWIIGNFQQGETASLPSNTAEPHPAVRTAQQNLLGGVALTLVGACVVGVSAVMWSWTPEERPRKVSASVMVAPGGGGFSLSGTFP
ncbi:hypothetical protein [Vitiosangium sp. GDMCC 1.1324]|uniref:hypothetical protein n=1 Tax=Vitiosangium sp. (strain GDMCC 1.1324) TaxID=2138576 RepID=UPI00130EACB3|nr:hypothetical protein [Vitiosangium sp. GDMCC 1.1324]